MKSQLSIIPSYMQRISDLSLHRMFGKTTMDMLHVFEYKVLRLEVPWFIRESWK